MRLGEAVIDLLVREYGLDLTQPGMPEYVRALHAGREFARDHLSVQPFGLAVKPAIIGRVLYFHVPVAGASPGAHGGGFVTVAPLPEKLWGGVTRTFPFRRLACSGDGGSSSGDSSYC